VTVDIVKTESCNAPLDLAFGYVADHRHVPEWMFGVQEFHAVGAQESGVGAEFEATIHLGARLHSRIRAVEWEENRAIGMDSVTGIPVRSRWYFSADGPERTTVTARVSYEPPFGPAGRMMSKVMEPFVQRAVADSARRVIANVERLAAERDGGAA
jgi:uncharacterized membrane protein